MIRCVRGVSVLIAHAQDTTSMNTDTILFIIEGPLYQASPADVFNTATCSLETGLIKLQLGVCRW